jgi:hypothetical protein
MFYPFWPTCQKPERWRGRWGVGVEGRWGGGVGGGGGGGWCSFAWPQYSTCIFVASILFLQSCFENSLQHTKIPETKVTLKTRLMCTDIIMCTISIVITRNERILMMYPNLTSIVMVALPDWALYAPLLIDSERWTPYTHSSMLFLFCLNKKKNILNRLTC